MALKAKAPAKVASPVSPLKKVPLRIRAEGAKEVVITGDFTQWAKDKIRLTPATGGEWIALLELAPGEYQYRLIVDGEWRDHAERRAASPTRSDAELRPGRRLSSWRAAPRRRGFFRSSCRASSVSGLPAVFPAASTVAPPAL
jgi:hypothetical protein